MSLVQLGLEPRLLRNLEAELTAALRIVRKLRHEEGEEVDEMPVMGMPRGRGVREPESDDEESEADSEEESEEETEESEEETEEESNNETEESEDESEESEEESDDDEKVEYSRPSSNGRKRYANPLAVALIAENAEWMDQFPRMDRFGKRDNRKNVNELKASIELPLEVENIVKQFRRQKVRFLPVDYSYTCGRKEPYDGDRPQYLRWWLLQHAPEMYFVGPLAGTSSTKWENEGISHVRKDDVVRNTYIVC